MREPRVGVGVIVRRDGKLLLGKRKMSHGEGTWCPPGEHLELFETLAQCARREVDEEAGLSIKNLQCAPATNDVFPEEHLHYVTVFVVADYDSGEVQRREPHKCDEWRWFSWEALPEPLCIPVRNLIRVGFHPFRDDCCYRCE